MSPEERLEALRDDARWQPVRLYPEHGRMPVPVHAQPWRVLVGAAIVIAAVAVVFGGISAFRGFGNEAGPMPLRAGAPIATRSPTDTPSVPSSELLATAKLPPDVSAGTAELLPLPFPNDGSVCGAISTDARFWTIAGMSVDDVLSWLTQNSPSGMAVRAGIWKVGGNRMTNGGYVLDAASTSAGQGLLFTVASIQDYGAAIRIDALDLPQGTRCVVNSLNELDPSPAAAAAKQLPQQAGASQ